ncbi:MAG: helix-turn-helix transcriptional regulator, partial [Oscillospiraceae bacterium]|nr:helix-turn-helix transcriptional regulator [Oscillospiraceae bacterium]
MEKRTIGTFIAALRKANGMTQRELAERLNVSDKTVSRWERDDGSPDLAAIPVIAEIFGITCDELLRGERRSPAEREVSPSSEGEQSSRGTKERR